MFVGHYGVSFAAKRLDGTIPLWLLFIAVPWLDIVWAPRVLLGVEKVRIVPGITASNPLDLWCGPALGDDRFRGPDAGDACRHVLRRAAFSDRQAAIAADGVRVVRVRHSLLEPRRVEGAG
jgi:hypothetical protein